MQLFKYLSPNRGRTAEQPSSSLYSVKSWMTNNPFLDDYILHVHRLCSNFSLLYCFKYMESLADWFYEKSPKLCLKACEPQLMPWLLVLCHIFSIHWHDHRPLVFWQGCFRLNTG